MMEKKDILKSEIGRKMQFACGCRRILYHKSWSKATWSLCKEHDERLWGVLCDEEAMK